MLNDVAKEWVTALRSGKYKQGYGSLRSEKDEYCCLGVLCDLAVTKGIIPAPELIVPSRDLYTKAAKIYKYAESALVLPEAVKIWAGIRMSSGRFENTSLVTQNDTNEVSFDKIAAIIESEPKGLFL